MGAGKDIIIGCDEQHIQRWNAILHGIDGAVVLAEEFVDPPGGGAKIELDGIVFDVLAAKCKDRIRNEINLPWHLILLWYQGDEAIVDRALGKIVRAYHEEGYSAFVVTTKAGKRNYAPFPD